MKKSKLGLAIALIGGLTVLFLILVPWIVRAWQPSEMKIVNLQGHPVLRIDAAGSVFDSIESKVAVINDHEGSFTLLKNNQKFAFQNDPAIQRDNDRYAVKIGGGFTFDVQPDGRVLVNGELYWRVFGYSQKESQRNRFIAALAISPLVGPNTDGPDNVVLVLPEHLKNAKYDSAIRREHILWIREKNEIYFADERLGESEIYYNLTDKVDELLKRQPGTNRIIYIAASWNIDYREIVLAVSRISASKESAKQVGFIVNGADESLADRFLLEIAPKRDPDEDITKLKTSRLDLIVSLSRNGQLKLMNGADPHRTFEAPPQPQPRRHRADAFAPGSAAVDTQFYWTWDPKGTLGDPSSLKQSLAEIFQERKAQHVYRSGLETRTDLPEDERVERTVLIRGSPDCTYGDVLKIIDIVTDTGANPIVLSLDDLPH
jgi:biopolymer transport protein ExbD